MGIIMKFLLTEAHASAVKLEQKYTHTGVSRKPGPDYWNDHRFGTIYAWQQTENPRYVNETAWVGDAPDGYRVPITEDNEGDLQTYLSAHHSNWATGDWQWRALSACFQ